MTNHTLKTRLQHIQTLARQLQLPVKLMEVCGTHTMTAFRSGLPIALPDNVQLISGPGCPVCVTPIDYVDQAITIARQPDVVITTFGDMIRVPGSQCSLEHTRAQGADIRLVYSPSDALAMAKTNRDKTIVFLGVGFETTAPAIAYTIQQAYQEGIANYKVLCAHKTMPQAMQALLNDPDIDISGFICPGHVSVITGTSIYQFISNDYHIPCVVVGFEPIDMVQGIELMLQQLAEKRATVEIQYSRSVAESGNLQAQTLLYEVFESCDSTWRGLGTIPGSGLKIKAPYQSLDALLHFNHLSFPHAIEPEGCQCGEVLRGKRRPSQCPLFRRTCTPATPVGACMVSSEGTCAAYYKYGK